MKDSIGLKYNNKSGFPLDFFVLKAAIDLVNKLLNPTLCNKAEICWQKKKLLPWKFVKGFY